MTWLTNWNYRKVITISNTESALSDYQVLVTIDTATLVIAGKLLSSCNDVRFTLSDSSTLLNYWIESGCNTGSTKIWIKISSILASPSTTIIYMYYGKSGASPMSDGTSTFDLFDDFLGSSIDSTKWNTPTVYSGGSYSVSGDKVTITATENGGRAISSKTAISNGQALEVIGLNVITKPKSGYSFSPVCFTTDNLNHVQGNLFTGQGYRVDWVVTNANNIYRVNGTTQPAIGTATTITMTTGETKRHTFKLDSSNVTYDIDQVQKNIASDNTYRSGLYVSIAPYAIASISVETVFVRKYTSPEPTYTIFAEQTDQSYTYRLPIVINNTINGNILTNYQILTTVDTSDANKFHNSAADIRFTSDTSSYNEKLWNVSYSYWIESGAGTSTTKIWINVDSIPASSTKTIYMYHGNSMVTSASNGNTTFDFFDDFNTALDTTNKWVSSGAGITVTGGLLQIRPDGTARAIVSKNYQITDGIIEMYSRNPPTSVNYDHGLIYRKETTVPDAWNGLNGYFLQQFTTSWRLYDRTPTEGAIASITKTDDTNWHIHRVIASGTSHTGQLDSDVSWTISGINSKRSSGYIGIGAAGSGWAGQDVDWVRIRKYTVTEPTISTPVSATSMTITPSETPCRIGFCTATANVTWTITGSLEFTFVPSIKIDGIPIVVDPPLTPVTVGPSRVVTQSFTVSGLTVGTHSICPDPN